MSYKRILNNYGIYHVYFRGIDHQAVFGLPENKEVFLRQLSESQKINNFQLYSYSIMNTHGHLLYQDIEKNMPLIIGNLLENYAVYYNAENKRSGPVFENPFKSKPVLTTNYFFTLASYIENNPVDAHLVEVYSDYQWNSKICGYSEYNLIDTMYLNHKFAHFKDYSLDQYIKTNSSKGQICNMEFTHMSDYEAKVCFINIVNTLFSEFIADFNCINNHKKSSLVKQAYYAGLSIRQIADISGLSIRFIRDNKGERNYL